MRGQRDTHARTCARARPRTCTHTHALTRTREHIDNRRPPQESCANPNCVTYACDVGAWGACSVSCGAGFQVDLGSLPPVSTQSTPMCGAGFQVDLGSLPPVSTQSTPCEYSEYPPCGAGFQVDLGSLPPPRCCAASSAQPRAFPPASTQSTPCEYSEYPL
jgi:hypothetical protein